MYGFRAKCFIVQDFGVQRLEVRPSGLGLGNQHVHRSVTWNKQDESQKRRGTETEREREGGREVGRERGGRERGGERGGGTPKP